MVLFYISGVCTITLPVTSTSNNLNHLDHLGHVSVFRVFLFFLMGQRRSVFPYGSITMMHFSQKHMGPVPISTLHPMIFHEVHLEEVKTTVQMRSEQVCQEQQYWNI